MFKNLIMVILIFVVVWGGMKILVPMYFHKAYSKALTRNGLPPLNIPHSSVPTNRPMITPDQYTYPKIQINNGGMPSAFNSH